MNKKKIAVTGGSGFMGSWLVDELISRGHDVVSIDNGFMTNAIHKHNGDHLIVADIRDRDAIEKAFKDVEIVYHLAAYAAEGQSFFSPIEINDINIRGADTVLVSAINNGVKKIVFTSSMAVYGHQKAPFTEDMPRKPADPYAAAKAYTENLLEIFHDIYGIDYTIIRPHNVYGPRQNMADAFRNVLGIWMNQILRNKPITIYGNGSQRRAFSYIKDLTPALANAGFEDAANSQIINLGADESYSINEAWDYLKRITEYNKEPIYELDRPGEVHHAFCSNEKAKEILNYGTRYTLAGGLMEMWDWAKSVGPQEPSYKIPLEITKRAPRLWQEKAI